MKEGNHSTDFESWRERRPQAATKYPFNFFVRRAALSGPEAKNGKNLIDGAVLLPVFSKHLKKKINHLSI